VHMQEEGHLAASMSDSCSASEELYVLSLI